MLLRECRTGCLPIKISMKINKQTIIVSSFLGAGPVFGATLRCERLEFESFNST